MLKEYFIISLGPVRDVLNKLHLQSAPPHPSSLCEDLIIVGSLLSFDVGRESVCLCDYVTM